MPKIEIQAEGLPEFLAKLKKDEIYGAPWREMFGILIKFGLGQAKDRAPRGTGELRGALISRMDAAEIPLWAVLTTKTGAAENKGFRYGFALDAGGGTRKSSGRQFSYHFRGSRRLTKKWFRGVGNLISRIVKREIRRADKKIEANWNK